MSQTTTHKAKLVLLHALTPVHVGTGQAVANVDLPIAREKATGFPIIPASAFKGVLRDYFRFSKEWVDDKLTKAFGSEPPKPNEPERQPEGGDWVFTDLRILCLPVRSFYGTFAYVTCPLVLRRFKQMMRVLGGNELFSEVPKVEDTQVLVASDKTLSRGNKVYFEELDLEAKSDEQTRQVAKELAQKLFGDNAEESQAFVERFAIVPDQVFDYLSETATEVAARVRLDDETKTVAGGALWYEELVPAESVFYGFVVHAKQVQDAQVSFDQLKVDDYLQIGGDATIGRGLCRVVI